MLMYMMKSHGEILRGIIPLRLPGILIIVQMFRSLIGRFEQFEALLLQSACSRYSISVSCGFLIWNFSACAVLFSASLSVGCLIHSVSLSLPWQPGIVLGILYRHFLVL